MNYAFLPVSQFIGPAFCLDIINVSNSLIQYYKLHVCCADLVKGGLGVVFKCYLGHAFS